MELRLLGSVEAVQNGQTVALGGPKPRLVLAALVLARGRLVSAHRLIDLLWEDDPPKSALGLLHTYMSGLRRALGPEAIVTDEGSYRLDSTGMRVDVYEFERKAQDPAEDAEAEWRGPALAGLTGSFARSQAKLLEEARLAVVERRVVAGLDRPGEVLTELRQLVEQHPFHERLRAHLITALDRTGRRRDAMAVFHETRRLLAEELGVEPGRELQEAYRALLEEHEPQAVPDLLPADIPDFVGREDEVRRIHQARIVAISGPPGAGKTTLAVHAARTFPVNFPGGRLYADLRGTLRPLDPFDVLGRFLRALGVAAGDLPATLDERVESYRMLTAACGVVVVLDDAADERQVRPLLPGGTASRCLIASRARLAALEPAEQIGMPLLGEEEGLALLTATAGGGADPAAAREILRLCGHLPLAVRIMAARLAARPDRPMSSMVARLREQRRILDELRVGDLEVRGSVALSYDALPAPARRALRLLGWLGVADFAPWVVAVLMDVTLIDADDVIDTLVHAHLLDVSGGLRFRLHDLVRVFAWERAHAEEEREELTSVATRAGELCLLLVEHASGGTPMRTLRPPRSGETSGLDRWQALLPKHPLDWLDVEQGTLVHVVERAGELDLANVATRLATALCSSSFAVENRFHHWWRTHTAALESARRAGDRSGEALVLSGLGWLRAEQDRLDEAIDYYRQALECDENPVTRLLLASVLRERGDLVAALATADEVLPALTDPRAVARAEHGRAMTLLELGDFAAARAGHEKALAAYQALGDDHGVGLVRRSIGIVFRAEGRLDEAARESEESLRQLSAAGDRLMIVYATQSLAKVRIRQGRGEEVRAELLSALDTCHEMQDGFGEALVRRTLGELELAAGRFTEAIGHLRQALDWWESLNLTLWRARTLRDLATALAGRGAAAEADATHLEAQRLFMHHGSREAGEPRRVVGHATRTAAVPRIVERPGRTPR
ncbi:BTAD domain-containing putative transcriptional regulator [Lentzea sp. NPDC005914]|uniref:AfsR/SARP family transcriptional regulator n=1 Tax=Lentzea sp. NPDC005914 TaxID=3154572 RepID=UPI0033EDF8EF